ncbi:MAG: CCA tRNA nucleotidyltransferase, partial [Cytophagales bacterium]|nr:CCA tRNA nucleotidyltransferase [Cytophagales bacterium]
MNFADVIKKKYQILQIIGEIADEMNIEARVIGGFVRDLILGRKNEDIDIVCLGDYATFVNTIAEKLNITGVSIYKNYGTAMIKFENLQLEFVKARKESYEHFSRNPIVQPATFYDDQLRRDFTINTLGISLNKKNFGELIDDLHGVEDLENKIIKTTTDPDITFDDDPLRMLRAIRFSTQLDFTIDPKTFFPIKKVAERIKIISQERITTELNKILLSPRPSRGIELLSKSGLLKIILPWVENLKGNMHIGNFSHKDVYYHSLQVMDSVAEKSDKLFLRWTGLLHDIAKPITKRFDPVNGFSFHGHEEIGARMIREIFTMLKIAKKDTEYVMKLTKLHLRPIAIAQDCTSDSGIRRLAFEAGEDLEDLMLLCRADITSQNFDKIQKYMN